MTGTTRTVLILAFVAAGAASAAATVHVTTTPPETIKTSTYYDSASRKLTVTCDVATRGLCRFTIVDGAQSKQLDLRSKTRATVRNVSGKARVCAVGRNEGQGCNWIAVES